MISEEEKRVTCSIKAGDAEEFQKFFDRNYQKVLTLILFLSKSNNFAEDAAQETFIKLWENRERLDENQSLIAYTRQISRNLIIDYLRKEQKVRQYTNKGQKLINSIVDKQENETIDNLDRKDLEYALQDALNCLSPKKQAMFIQSRFEDKTYKEIALEMETTPKAVERHIAKTVLFLKRRIPAYYNIWIFFSLLIEFIKK